MIENDDLIFVVFVVIMVLIFFILLVKRLYRKQPSPFDLQFGSINSGFQNGQHQLQQQPQQQGQVPTISVAVHLHETRGNSRPVRAGEINQFGVDTTPPPPFESVVGVSKAGFKVDDPSCHSSGCDMECPPPSYEEYLGFYGQQQQQQTQEQQQQHREMSVTPAETAAATTTIIIPSNRKETYDLQKEEDSKSRSNSSSI